MKDVILESFLERQLAEATELAEATDLLELWPIDRQRYLAHYLCRGLIQEAGEIRETEGVFTVGFFLPSDYLRRAEPTAVVAWIHPPTIWHPNVALPAICIGRMPPGTPLVDLLHQVYEIITWQRFTPNEFDALNRAACQWARNNKHRFPVDGRPLRWRASR